LHGTTSEMKQFILAAKMILFHFRRHVLNETKLF